jgi:hypothetical protein
VIFGIISAKKGAFWSNVLAVLTSKAIAQVIPGAMLALLTLLVKPEDIR